MPPTVCRETPLYCVCHVPCIVPDVVVPVHGQSTMNVCAVYVMTLFIYVIYGVSETLKNKSCPEGHAIPQGRRGGVVQEHTRAQIRWPFLCLNST